LANNAKSVYHPSSHFPQNIEVEIARFLQLRVNLRAEVLSALTPQENMEVPSSHLYKEEKAMKQLLKLVKNKKGKHLLAQFMALAYEAYHFGEIKLGDYRFKYVAQADQWQVQFTD
jgi:hypothetical protein